MTVGEKKQPSISCPKCGNYNFITEVKYDKFFFEVVKIAEILKLKTPRVKNDLNHDRSGILKCIKCGTRI